MDNAIRRFLTDDILTLTEVAALYRISVFAARKRAERGNWPYVLKTGIRLYLRSDLPDPGYHKEPA